MKPILTILLLLLTTTSFAQKMSYSQWKREAQTEMRLIPKFGNYPKTEAQKEADKELIKAYLAQEGSNRKASELLVKLGFDYFYKSDLKTAMMRFNQAWLLDPSNENVFWGFGAIYFHFEDKENAIKQYDEGLKLNSKSSNLLTDKATIYMNSYMKNGTESDYVTALKLLKKSYLVDTRNQNTLFKMSVLYFMKKDCQNAFKYYRECQALGGRVITRDYTLALTQQCK